jgi:hypothetical protein
MKDRNFFRLGSGKTGFQVLLYPVEKKLVTMLKATQGGIDE